MTRLPDRRLTTAEELFKRQSPVVPCGHSGFFRRLVSVVMNAPMLPEIPGLSFVPSLLRPRELPTKVTAPFVVTTRRCRYPVGPVCAAIAFHKKRIVVKRRPADRRRRLRRLRGGDPWRSALVRQVYENASIVSLNDHAAVHYKEGLTLSAC